ncbi:MAG: hypothetical protein P8M12_03545 [Flavobacteriales bacterium]|jgi:hypothetical protein|nr:hypothetical protein [Flavobacteriales bacterium]
MKTTTKVSHPVLDISIFLRENTYLIKIVLNQFEQIYRIKQADVTGMDDVKKMLTTTFLDKVYLRFVDMSKDFKDSFININKIEP